MKRKIGKTFLLFVFASLAFSGCFSPWKGEEATLTLLLGNTAGSRQQTAVPNEDPLSYVVHIIELNGPTGRQSHTIKSSNPFSVTVMPGYWHISVRALLNSSLYAQGEGGAEIKAGQNNHVEIKMKPLIKDKLIFVTDNLDYFDEDELIPGSLRYALEDIHSYKENITIMVMLPPGSEIKLKDGLAFSAQANLTIEGNGVTLSKIDEPGGPNSQRLMTIEKNKDDETKVTIRRIHFKGSNGGAISNNGNLNLESCIFSKNTVSESGGAIYNGEFLDVKGCTFYKNTADQGGTIWNEGEKMELTGNLFYENNADSFPVIGTGRNSMNESNGYNVVDVNFGTGPNAPEKCGWTAGTGDQYFPKIALINTTTFKPVSALSNFIPASAQTTLLNAGFPTTDFYGQPRNWPGAPGAVK